ncbi:hypothetical protein BAE44_0004234 [Dichanthelium oligosanthes]|uniref:Uncharacterized protein n=1 Tax=Dichanthelium oligosanthes TaxID=888268 RepID=A0A1E5WBW8_9POAL|nr:hypothetical protein BAE44_0004234 [Dichanthelium oligosanthes]
MAKVALLVLFLVEILSVLAAAARPLAGDGSGGWLDDGLGVVAEILRAAKSGPGPPSHCCN